jgi:hypothetical protein
MKDILITGVRIKKELITLSVCFLIGFVANIVAIIFYKTVYAEVITSLGYILVFTFVLYLIWSLLRILVWFIGRCLHAGASALSRHDEWHD